MSIHLKKKLFDSISVLEGTTARWMIFHKDMQKLD